MQKYWDNAPHHREIETFPFHIHTGNEIFPSEKIRLDEILKTIERIRLILGSDNT